jgi:FKBP-type peptidyl-prolyl cis-trans isomerase FklB
MAVIPIAGAQTPAAAPAAGAPAASSPAADPTNEQTSYLFGLTFGEQMHSVGISNQVSTDAIARGLKDGLQGKKSTRADQQQIQGFVQSVMAAQLAHNKAAAQEFLTTNGKEKGVKTTADGLEYKVLAAGDAKAPAIGSNDEVTVNYRGKLLDGSEFDSSYGRGVPATFKVGGVIKGWQEALVLMKPGAKWQLFVPPELAYDASPRPGIPAGSLLIFDVELLSVKAAGDAPVALPGKSGTGTPPVSHKVMPPLKPSTPPADPATP